MKVLMLGWELPPHNSGGLGRACYDLCKSLSSNNIDIEFILPYEADHDINFMKITSASTLDIKDYDKNFNVYNSSTFLNNNITSHSFFDQYKMYSSAIENIIDGNEYDIVHAHDWLTFDAAVRLKRKYNMPIILHVHSIESDRSGGNIGNPIVREIEEISLNLADKVFAVSELTKQSIIRDYGVPEDKIDVVHNSLNIEDIVPLSGLNSYRYIEMMKNNGYKIILNFGRLTIQKGLPNLLEAMSKVIKLNNKVLLLIIGSGEQYFELVKLSADLGIAENVIFTDFQRGKKLRDGIAIADLFVMPSISEPFGLTALESIAYNTPALVSKQSGVGEVMKNILKVDFWDIDEMTNKIYSVITNKALLDNLRENSFNELNNISWNESAVKVKRLYQLQLGGKF